MGHLDFDIVSTVRCPTENFDIRISDFRLPDATLGYDLCNTKYAIRFTKLPSTSVENPLQIDPFMQNKPNFDKGQNKPNHLYKRELRKFHTPSDNEKQTQNKPNLLDAQMNVNTVITMNYEQITMNNANKNKPNQTQFQTQRLRGYEWLAQQGQRTFYAIRRVRLKKGGKQKVVWMHREIMKAGEGEFCDHINHNGLDNRRVNLRPATHSENARRGGTNFVDSAPSAE